MRHNSARRSGGVIRKGDRGLGRFMAGHPGIICQGKAKSGDAMGQVPKKISGETDCWP